jgi:hypothetical protein
VTFTPAGSIIQNSSGSSSTFTLAPHAVGDLVLMSATTFSATVFATGISSANATWEVLATYLAPTDNYYITVFAGTVTSVTSATATVAWSGAVSYNEINGQEFSSSAGAWYLDAWAGQDAGSMPPLTPSSGSPELYWQYTSDNATAAGSGSGFTVTANWDGGGMAYNPSVTSVTTGATWSDGQETGGIAVLMAEGTAPPQVTEVGTPATPATTTSGTGTVTVAGTWSGTQPRTAGDYLLAHVTAHGSTSAAATAQASGTTGWTKLQEEVNGAQVSAIWGKVAAGTDAAPSFTSSIAGTSAQTRLTCELVELTGQDTTTPVLTGDTTAAANTTSQVLTAAAATGRARSIALTGVVEGFTTAAAKTFTRSAGWVNLANTGSASTYAHSSFDVQTGIGPGVTPSNTVGWGSGTITSSAGAMVVLQPPPSTTPVSGTDASGTTADGGESAAATVSSSDASGTTADSQSLAGKPADSDASGTVADSQSLAGLPASSDASGLMADTGEKIRAAAADAPGQALDAGEHVSAYPADTDTSHASDASEAVRTVSADAPGQALDAGEHVTVNPGDSDASHATTDAGEALHAALSAVEASGPAADSQGLLAALGGTDSSLATDGSGPHAVSSSDASGATLDAGEHIAVTLATSDASGAAADAQALVAHPASSDTGGPAAEASLVTLGAFSTDASGGTADAGETIAATPPAQGETGHGADGGEAVTARPASSDVSGSTADAGEKLSLAGTAAETGHGTDAGESSSSHPASADASGPAADVGTLAAHLAGSDAASAAVDAGGPPSAHLAGADASGTAADAGEHVISGHIDADAGHGTDAGEQVSTPLTDTDRGLGTDSGFTYSTSSDASGATAETQQAGPVGTDAGHGTDSERTFWPADSDASGGVTETEYWSGPVYDTEIGLAADAGEVIALADMGPYPGGDSSVATDTYTPGIDVYTYVPPGVITIEGGFQVVWHRPDGSAVLILSTDCMAEALRIGRVIERSTDVQFPSDSDSGATVEDQQETLDVEVSIRPALSVQVILRDITA